MLLLEIDKNSVIQMDNITHIEEVSTRKGEAIIKFWFVDGTWIVCDPDLTEYLWKVIRPMVANNIADIDDPKTKYYIDK